MDPHTQLCTVVSHEIAEKLTAHKEKEREHVEALLASQKHLTSNVRTLINSLDQVLALSSPKFSSNQPDLLRSVVSRARLLQKQLDVVSVRIQRMQVHVRGSGLIALYNAYSYTQSKNNTAYVKLTAGTFEADVHKLLTRYKQGAPRKGCTSGTIKDVGERNTPHAVFEALRAATIATSERSSSPLNYHPTMQTYYSPFEADSLFASSGEATACRWTGSSIATPDPAPADVHKFVWHAIESAKAAAQVATLTVLLIPASTEAKNPGYLKLLRTNTEYCKPLMRIPAAKLRMETQPKYMLNTSQLVKPTSDMLLMETANQAGFAQYSTTRNDQVHTGFSSDMLQALNATLPASAQVTAATLKGYCSRTAHLLDSAGATQQRTRATAKYRTVLFALKYNWRQTAYTDGSYIAPRRTESTDDPSESPTPEQALEVADGSLTPAPRGKVPRIGAAVYIRSQQTCSTTGKTEVACLPSDEAYSFDDTINRAELAAAGKAISMKCSHIATDSLAAMFQIHKIVTKPQDISLGFHRHANLLQQIAQSIASNGRKIHIYKVKSHIGIPGNERADEIATSVAKGTRKPDEVIATSSNNRPGMAWPHHPEVLEQGREVPSPPVPAIAHDVEKVSHAFMTSTVVPFREMVNTLKVQTGTFYSQKRAWWYGRAASDRCVLCGQLDGTLHAPITEHRSRPTGHPQVIVVCALPAIHRLSRSCHCKALRLLEQLLAVVKHRQCSASYADGELFDLVSLVRAHSTYQTQVLSVDSTGAAPRAIMVKAIEDVGLGNRLPSIATAYVIALFTKRLLLVESTAVLQHIELPFPADWHQHKRRYSQFEDCRTLSHSHVAELHQCDQHSINSTNSTAAGSALADAVLLKYRSIDYDMPLLQTNHQMQHLFTKFFPDGEVFHAVAKYLFTPGGVVTAAMQPHLQQANDCAVGLQMRHHKPFGEQVVEAEHFAGIARMLHAAVVGTTAVVEQLYKHKRVKHTQLCRQPWYRTKRVR
ncbi:hypothetical protein COO60DRAFT_1626613 [Scenedesmus sp. NREL 46B-D3]|nr:hypothetical protein COO60DRAFT_1626613 [Scenedesmus sp. NREL 46B-D3]